MANGFARAYCDKCGRDFLIALFCKKRGECPYCNTRRVIETAAHLAEHVFPCLPVRQWVLSVPKRLRFFALRCRPARSCAAHLVARGGTLPERTHLL
ncbi:MAG: transposase zinc-binding domain-containing protein [Gallionella sp.]|nr:transposase zinc-binding domain-containing protein [Gallionella sp.]